MPLPGRFDTTLLGLVVGSHQVRVVGHIPSFQGSIQAERRLEHDVVHRHSGRGQRDGRLGERRRDERRQRERDQHEESLHGITTGSMTTGLCFV